ncbi:MAG: hypothetical protein AB7N91_18105 [Candidatus Tectimicrobiota bacterium]
MAKKVLEAATSKLARQQAAPAERSSLVSMRKTPHLPKSFRLGAVHLERLRNISERLSEEAGRPISETEIIKGLLLLGEKTDTKKLLLAVKDAVFEGG